MSLEKRISKGDIINEITPYSVGYKIFDELKGDIDYKHKIMWLNPIYDEDGATLAYHTTQHFYDKVFGEDLSENMLRKEATILYDKYTEFFDKYADYKLNNLSNYINNLPELKPNTWML